MKNFKSLFLIAIVLFFSNCKSDGEKSAQNQNDKNSNKLILSDNRIKQNLFTTTDYSTLLSVSCKRKTDYKYRANKQNPTQRDTLIRLKACTDRVSYLKTKDRTVLLDLELSEERSGFKNIQVGQSKSAVIEKLGRENAPDTVVVSGQKEPKDFILTFKDGALSRIKYQPKALN